jgi:hypothetical protein
MTDTQEITDQEIAEIRALLEAVTPGPWAWEATGEKSNGWCLGLAESVNGQPYEGRVPDDEFVNETLGERSLIMEHDAATCNYADPEFISRARQIIPKLLAALDAAKARIARLEYALCFVHDGAEDLTHAREIARGTIRAERDLEHALTTPKPECG